MKLQTKNATFPMWKKHQNLLSNNNDSQSITEHVLAHVLVAPTQEDNGDEDREKMSMCDKCHSVTIALTHTHTCDNFIVL